MRCDVPANCDKMPKTNSGRFGTSFCSFGKVWALPCTSGTLAHASSGQYSLVGIDYDFPCTRRGRQTKTCFRSVGEYLA
jgi:hypothetical protein